MADDHLSSSMSRALKWTALSFVRWIFCALPEKWALFLGARMGDILRVLLPKKLWIMRENIELSNLALPPERSGKAFERDVFRHFGRMGVEFLRLRVLSDHEIRERVRVDGLEHFRQEIAKGKGVILLSGHIGCWEQSLRRITLEAPGKVHPVIRRIKDPVVHTFVDEHRRKFGRGESILSDKGVRPLLRILSRGEVLVVVLDQNAGLREGVFVPFFGRLACTYSSLAKLSLLLGIPVVPVGGLRRPEGTHWLNFHPPIPPFSDLPQDEAIYRQTALYTRAIEEMIRPHPEQWIWMHRRWKTRPPGEDRVLPSRLPESLNSRVEK
jgi:KDO2-lipid IV(A) lauroyltransferase